MKKIYLFTTLLCILFAAVSCDKDNGGDPITPTDYSNTTHWIHIENSPTKQVDVFYVYPTVYRGTDDYAPIDDPETCDRAQSSYQGQATAFSTVANLYAPYYRQSSLGVMSLSIPEKNKAMSQQPLIDVTEAFEYFIDHYNNNRPFILVGHSQGSNLLLLFLKEYMKKHPDVHNRMIAAYLTGYPVTQTFLNENPHLKFAQNATDSKVIISYNTEAPVIDGANPVMAEGPGVCINPLSWTRSGDLAGVELNLGTYRRNASGVWETLPPEADAQINFTRGTVICSTVNPDDYPALAPMFPRGCYHGEDFPFYYFNIRKNAEDRVQAYLNAH